MNNTMKKTTFFISNMFIVTYLVSIVKENYHYKSDVLWVTVPNHAPTGFIKQEEKQLWRVQFYKYGIPRDNVNKLYEIGGDMMPVADTKEV